MKGKGSKKMKRRRDEVASRGLMSYPASTYNIACREVIVKRGKFVREKSSGRKSKVLGQLVFFAGIQKEKCSPP